MSREHQTVPPLADKSWHRARIENPLVNKYINCKLFPNVRISNNLHVFAASLFLDIDNHSVQEIWQNMDNLNFFSGPPSCFCDRFLNEVDR